MSSSTPAANPFLFLFPFLFPPVLIPSPFPRKGKSGKTQARRHKVSSAAARRGAAALEGASRRQTAKDMDRYVNEMLRERDLERQKKLISQSRDIAYLRKMLDAD